jgi:biopolymer transport protein ExbB
MERRLVVIATVAQTAPLLGLFGTVVGLAEMIIGIQNDAPLIQSVHVTAPLLKALASTAAGLAVAIPSYAAFNVLVVKIDRIVLDMERAKSELTAFFAGAATAPQGDGAQTGKDA